MSEYKKFGDYLDKQNEPFSIKFEEIEAIIGEKLPPLAYQYSAWWSNNSSYPLMKVVLLENWRSTNPNLVSKKIEFYKSSESSLLEFVKKVMPVRMKANYQPIVIKTLVEKNEPYIASVKEIKEKLSELNFDRDNFDVNEGFDTVMKDLSKYVSNENDNVSFIETPKTDEISEILRICGQKIAKWHIEEIIVGEPILWRVKPGKEEDNNVFPWVDEFLSTKTVGVGWNELGDLSKFENESKIYEHIDSIKSSALKSAVAAISHKMKAKDLVVCTKAQQEIVDFGIIVGKYFYEKDNHGTYSHRRKVVWLNQGPLLKEDLPEHTLGGSLSSAHQVNDDSRKERLLSILIGRSPIINFTMDDIQNFDDPEVKKIIKVLDHTKNVILYGPPGTGKTRMANIIKEHLMQEKSYVPTSNNITPTWKSVAALILLENKCQPLHYKEIGKRANSKNIKLSIAKTPEETLSRDIRADIDKNGENSIFVKLDNAEYGLNIPTTFVKAAEIILFAYNKPMHSDEITKIAIENKMIEQRENPGITPEKSMNQVLSQEISKNDKNSIFERIDGGTYALRSSVNNSQNKENPKRAILFSSDEGADKINKFKEFILKNGKILWGVGWYPAQIKESEYPMTGYIKLKGDVIATGSISKISRQDETDENDLKLSAKVLGYGDNHPAYIHFNDIQLCHPFPFTELHLYDKTKDTSPNSQRFSYVEELDDNSDSKKNENRAKFVTFHPSFAYEDFLEGIRPVTKNKGKDNETIGYELLPGIFKEICTEAGNDAKHKYLLIIDEINRGNISKIFGELITLIEDDKRGDQLHLAYSKEPFSVPKNLYILGTMNTADKSLVQLDTALRRRFAFVELMPNSELQGIKETVVEGISIKVLMDKLNEKIREKYRDKQIGHSYFLKIRDMGTLQYVFKYNIIPLLQDYFYGDYEILSEILGNEIISKEKLVVDEKIIDDPEKFKGALQYILGKKDENESPQTE